MTSVCDFTDPDGRVTSQDQVTAAITAFDRGEIGEYELGSIESAFEDGEPIEPCVESSSGSGESTTDTEYSVCDFTDSDGRVTSQDQVANAITVFERGGIEDYELGSIESAYEDGEPIEACTPPVFEISLVEAKDDYPGKGDTTVEVEITNTGGTAGTAEVTQIGPSGGSGMQDLDPGESTTGVATVGADEHGPGTYDIGFETQDDRLVRTVTVPAPANLMVDSCTLGTGSVAPGETTDIPVTASNTGDLDAEAELSLSIAGETFTESGVIRGGETLQHTFSVSVDTPGEYPIEATVEGV